MYPNSKKFLHESDIVPVSVKISPNNSMQI